MCGIVGVLGLRGQDVPLGVLDAMTDALEHRGPDGRGTWTDGPVGFGHRWLRMYGDDHQPATRDGRTVVWNGELYGDLPGSELDAVFAAESPADLDGMFAFAVWDGDALHLARDRFGEKPLYYYRSRDWFLFASEPKALFAHPACRPTADWESLEDYAVWQHPRGSRTMFRGVRRVEPGSQVTVWRDGTIRKHQYWTPDRTPPPAETLTAVVRRAVVDRIRGDRPWGAYLSGGLDSSTVACIAEPPVVFTGEFADPGFSEVGYAEAVADHIGARLEVVTITPDDLVAEFDRLVVALDEPAAGPGAFAQWMVARRASELGIRMMFGGQGGDEVFGGYARYAAALGYPAGYEELEARAYLATLVRSDGAAAGPDARREYLAGGATPLQRATGFDIRNSLPALLHVEDRVSMAWGIETRLPFLDPRVLAAVNAQPDDYRVDHGVFKASLRRVAEEVGVPRAVTNRRDKMGFPVPLRRWADGPLHEWVSDLLGGVPACGERELWGRMMLAGWRRLVLRESEPVVLAA